jgi:hypothetical protein
MMMWQVMKVGGLGPRPCQSTSGSVASLAAAAAQQQSAYGGADSPGHLLGPEGSLGPQ